MVYYVLGGKLKFNFEVSILFMLIVGGILLDIYCVFILLWFIFIYVVIVLISFWVLIIRIRLFLLIGKLNCFGFLL